MFEHVSMHIWDQISNKNMAILFSAPIYFGLKCDKFGTTFFIKDLEFFFFKKIVKTGTKFNFDQITQF